MPSDNPERRGRRKPLTAAEAFFFTAVVLADIWLVHFRTRWGDVAPLVFVVVSFWAHGETAASLGLTFLEARDAVRLWRMPLAIGAVAVAVGIFASGRPIHLAYQGLLYFVWCVVQQILLQNIIYRRLRFALGANWDTSVLAGSLFALAHVPNPVLVPATLGWGTISTRMFERRPSLLVLAFMQTLLSSLLLWLTPGGLSQGFRVGPGYDW